MAGPVHRTIRDGVAVVELDSPPENALDLPVLRALSDWLARSEAEPEIVAIVIAARGDFFSSGSDIREIGQKPLDPQLHELVDRIEAAAKPVVVAMQGDALGGGCEIALAAHRRIIAPKARIGMPQVRLGLVPAAGGTQRLPRLVGLTAALSLIAGGQAISAQEARRIGLVDDIEEGHLLNAAIRLARSLAGQMQPRLSLRAPPPVAPEEWEAAVARVKREARGRIAPIKAIELVRQVRHLPYTIGVPAERRAYLELAASSQSRALRHLFVAERQADRPDLAGIRHLGVAGASVSALGLAISASEAGMAVTIGPDLSGLAPSLPERLTALMARTAQAQGWAPAKRAEITGRIRLASHMAGLQAADLVLESGTEGLAARQDLLTKLEALIRPSAVIATLSALADPAEICADLQHPERFAALQVFSPMQGVRIAEIGRHSGSTPEALALLLGFCRQIGKIGIVSVPRAGTIGGRLLNRFRAQCLFMLEEGALPAEIDSALESYGLVLGPFAAQDLAGLDAGRARLRRNGATETGERSVPLVEKLCELGRFGRRVGKGWHSYRHGYRQADPEVETLIRAHAAATGRGQTVFTPEMIQRRILAAMANEGAKLLEEGVAATAADIDLIAVHGHGFPAHRGGPMHEADHLGLRALLGEVEASAARDGTGFAVSPLLTSLARSGGAFTPSQGGTSAMDEVAGPSLSAKAPLQAASRFAGSGAA
ncbi:MAG: enoyl-CoA hydratase/isomerase family protein [Proteobacteria bacterium]|nr:enoyl-CoA hydratase/isomerase family protein [Pseudomonadota bacterium]